MYGTVARMRVKPGMEERLRAFSEAETSANMPGFVAQSVFRMDADPNEYYLAVVFESKEAYFANANSPEQHARYEEMVAMLEGAPEWHDGEVVELYPPR